jgi:hypothetical protein
LCRCLQALPDRFNGIRVSHQLVEAHSFASEDRAVDRPWWLAAPQLKIALEQQQAVIRTVVCYQFGDAVLEVATDDSGLLERFEQLYGECAVLPPFAPDQPRVRCTVRRGADSAPILVTFLQGAPPDPAAGALSLFQPTGIMPPYSVYDSPIPGWRLAGCAKRPILAVSGGHVLVDSQLTRPDFLVEYLVTASLAAEPGLLVAHAGSVRIGNSAVLLAGPTHSGKTTLSLHLAARGHGLYTDDAAVIRMATTEVVPLRQAVRVRTGPRAPELESALTRLVRTRPERIARDADGSMLIHIGELFPGALPRPAKLRAAFFLNGFGDQPSLQPFQFTLQDLDRFDCLASMDMAFKWWGLGHGHRAMRVLALRQVLARLPCWLLTTGGPVETTELIEHTMEQLCS